MRANRPAYVIDTNVLIDYPSMIYFEKKRPVRPTINLDNAHLIIPMAVVRELSEFRKHNDEHGKTAKVLVNQLWNLIENSKVTSMRQVYRLHAAVEIKRSNQLISVLPMQRELLRYLPFYMADDDMDDQIIAATIAVSLALSDSNLDGSFDGISMHDKRFDNVTLLTNDKELAIRAYGYGVKTSRYKYKYAESFAQTSVAKNKSQK